MGSRVIVTLRHSTLLTKFTNIPGLHGNMFATTNVMMRSLVVPMHRFLACFFLTFFFLAPVNGCWDTVLRGSRGGAKLGFFARETRPLVWKPGFLKWIARPRSLATSCSPTPRCRSRPRVDSPIEERSGWYSQGTIEESYSWTTPGSSARNAARCSPATPADTALFATLTQTPEQIGWRNGWCSRDTLDVHRSWNTRQSRRQIHAI